MDVVFVGTGRLATNLAFALHSAGHHIVGLYSRTAASAQMLAERLPGFSGVTTDSLSELPTADVCIIAVKDAVISTLLPALREGRESCCFYHTAGSVPLSVFEGTGLQHYGVLYPMQTFSKERLVDFSHVPFYIEAVDEETLDRARKLALTVSDHVSELSSSARRHLHLAAVFACNFVNHCYELSAEVLEGCGLPFSAMHSLIEETARKAMTLHPHEAQTGPAVRYDEQVIEAQSLLLADQPHLREVYDLMSQSIHRTHTQPKSSHSLDNHD